MSALLALTNNPLKKQESKRLNIILQTIFRERPPSYAPEKPIWDVQILLDYIAAGRPNKSLTLRQLGGRLACLIRLATVHRSCDLCRLDLRSMSWTNNCTSVHFILNAPSKTVNAKTELSRAKKLQTLSLEQLPLHTEPKECNLCPVRALKCYLKKTKPIRQMHCSLKVMNLQLWLQPQ